MDTEEKVSGLSKLAAMAKKPWVWVTGLVAAVALLLTGLNSILREARALPGEWGETADQFSSWYYEYDEWPGRWTSVPEGWVDLPDWNLAEEDVRLHLEIVEGGRIDGFIESQSICDKVFFFEMLMVEGQIVSPDTAQLLIFDFIEGKKTGFAVIEVERDGIVLTVTPIEDPRGLFSEGMRIARDSQEYIGDESSDGGVCPTKKMELFQRAMERIANEQG